MIDGLQVVLLYSLVQTWFPRVLGCNRQFLGLVQKQSTKPLLMSLQRLCGYRLCWMNLVFRILLLHLFGVIILEQLIYLRTQCSMRESNILKLTIILLESK
jgi:hypothetical protein